MTSRTNRHHSALIYALIAICAVAQIIAIASRASASSQPLASLMQSIAWATGILLIMLGVVWLIYRKFAVAHRSLAAGSVDPVWYASRIPQTEQALESFRLDARPARLSKLYSVVVHSSHLDVLSLPGQAMFARIPLSRVVGVSEAIEPFLTTVVRTLNVDVTDGEPQAVPLCVLGEPGTFGFGSVRSGAVSECAQVLRGYLARSS